MVETETGDTAEAATGTGTGTAAGALEVAVEEEGLETAAVAAGLVEVAATEVVEVMEEEAAASRGSNPVER